MADFRQVAQNWLDGDFDQQTKMQIIELRNNDPAGFEDAFYKNLEFGTGGLRGIMGVGTNRMNKYTVGMATQGLANYILKHVDSVDVADKSDLRVVISYDSRNHSKEFAKITADVLSANGLHVFIFDNIRPTPEMSYAVRLKGAVAGVMITASNFLLSPLTIPLTVPLTGEVTRMSGFFLSAITGDPASTASPSRTRRLGSSPL